ncbi:uncharacterized protein LOC119291838 isoform X1 [Triticum dicoccoides]|uniref:uncharacterized protein LOC119291838 isoform X1 n=1 Tax=Triticum dicoccoides TaxID=85692 RepID=UPI00188F75E4|nr:uncharacterized protein LOC119291838 isoform X1 [Triticum dicoccoides]
MVRVRNILDLAGEREVREFLSFFGEIEHVDISPDVVATGRTAYATFKDVESPRDNAAALVYFAGRKLGRRFCLLSLIYCTSGGCGNSASMRRRLFLPCRRRGPPLCAATSVGRKLGTLASKFLQGSEGMLMLLRHLSYL